MLKNKSPKFYIWFAIWTLVATDVFIGAAILWFKPALFTAESFTGDSTLVPVLKSVSLYWAMGGVTLAGVTLVEALKALKKIEDGDTEVSV